MSNAFVNPLAPKKPSVVEAARKIKSWTRELLELEDAAVVSTSELACHLPGCPPRETVVLVMQHRQNTVQFSIHKAMIDVTRDDVRRAATHEER
ncbi:hypothetical protein [Martelella soudanensis]|uniref:hypothetical protein n=1 Tax=unclassified Martelella TaxID=2629616 RepID=UPI001FEDDFF6|nr:MULTISPECIES: hypothetical protein [unclassified Martelella]